MDDIPNDIEILDLSTSGCQMASDVYLPSGTPLTLGIPGIGVKAAEIVRSGNGVLVCRFFEPVPDGLIAVPKEIETVVEGPFELMRRKVREDAYFPQTDTKPSLCAKFLGLLRW